MIDEDLMERHSTLTRQFAMLTGCFCVHMRSHCETCPDAIDSIDVTAGGNPGSVHFVAEGGRISLPLFCFRVTTVYLLVTHTSINPYT